MKKNKTLYRCYLGAYFLWLFGALLAPLLMIKVSTGFALTMLIIACLALAGLITSHVFYNKKRQWFGITSLVSHGVTFALIITAFITEMIYTAQGQLGLYAVIMGSITLFFYGLIAIYLPRIVLKVMKETKEKAARQAAYEATKL